MPRPESDAHGRHHRSVEVGVDPVVDDTHGDDSVLYGETFDHIPSMDIPESDEVDMVILSNGARLPSYAVEEYLASLDTGVNERKFDKVDALVMGSVATMSAVALALAVRRLKKNH